ncbi:MAG: LysR family transcriptional regulator [Verrucomicrobiota bacterium]|jgi:DNA-binding transcriptional LysR family regulator
MNVHHLEVFYHVVLNQGVSQAARALDKEQPTLSKQINDLEDSLRTRLYHRRPFGLTERGETLFRAIEPFFRDLGKIEAKVKGDDSIRIGASPIVLTLHLPAMEKQVRKQFPNLRLVLRESNQPQLLQWLERGEIDLAITLLPGELPQKIFAQPLVQIPLILLVPKSSRLRFVGELWKEGEIQDNLICLTQDEMVCRHFQQGLEAMEIEWRPRIEVGSLSLVEHYVQEGYGIGLSVRVPGIALPPNLRAIDLPDFRPLSLGMLWRDNEDKLLRAFREQAEARARQMTNH